MILSVVRLPLAACSEHEYTKDSSWCVSKNSVDHVWVGVKRAATVTTLVHTVFLTFKVLAASSNNVGPKSVNYSKLMNLFLPLNFFTVIK